MINHEILILMQEPSIMDAQVTQRDPIPIMHSHFIVKTHGSRSRKHARIEVMMETDCSPQLIKGGMEWLSKNAECPGQHERLIIIALYEEDKNVDGL
jgi:hypothetical protein